MSREKANKNVKEVGIWIRVSTEDQAKGESPAHHEKRARMYAEAKNWKVVDVYDLSGVSGKSVKDHPETKRMLNDVKTGKIKGLLFSKLARLARNTKELLEFAEIFKKYGADLVSLSESIDTSSPAGRLFYTMIAAMAQWEREEIAERVAASVPIRAKMGKPLGGAAPLGYRWNEKKLEINPDEAPIVVRMFEIFSECHRLLTTARALNKEGYRTRRGKFTRTTVERLLRNPVYKGLRRANYTKSLGDKKAWKLKPEKEWVYYSVDAIIPEELWNMCNKILEKRKGKFQPPPKKGKYLFSGIIRCECGTKMYVGYKKTKIYRCRKCENKISEEVLLNQYLEGLKKMILEPGKLQAIFEVEGDMKEKEKRLRILKKELQSLEKSIDNVIELWSDKMIDKETFAERFNPLKKRKAEIRSEIPKLEGEIDFLKVTRLSKEYVLDQAKNFYSLWPSLNDEEMRELIESLTDSITIGDETITISYYYIPDFKADKKSARNPMGS